MKKTLLVTTLTLILLTVSCSSSGASSSTFPKSVGTFTLADGPTAEKKEKGDTTPTMYLSEYKSADGVSVANSVTTYPTADEAKKKYQELKAEMEGGLLASESFKETDNKIVYVKKDVRTRVVWAKGTAYYDVSSRDNAAALKFADVMSNK